MISRINLTRVRDIDWTNPNIDRAGIVPICIEDGHKWIGLAINKFSTTITTIGGTYEDNDHDLLSTAVREFNEEMGNNMRPLTEEAVYNYYAVKSESSINILLPINRRIINFNQTDEIYDMIWITPKQFSIIIKKSPNLTWGGDASSKGVLAFPLGGELKLIANKVIEAVENNLSFIPIKSDEIFERPPKKISSTNFEITTDINSLIQDINTPELKWYRLALVAYENIIGIMYDNYKLYILTLSEKEIITELLSKLRIIIYFSLIEDTKTSIGKLLTSHALSNPGKIRSIEGDMIRFNYDKSEINTFINEVNKIRKTQEEERVFDELSLIINYENMLYQDIQTQGKLFSKKKACFLTGISSVNYILSKHDNILPYHKLKNLFEQNYQCRNPRYFTIIGVMLNLGLIEQDRRTTNVSITS